jgi:hypothetical protein
LSGLDAVYARAGGFIALEGAALDRLQFETLLRERDASAVLDALSEQQESSGAFRAWRRDGESDPVASTLRALSYLDALGLLDHPIPEAAVGFLSAGQAKDGGWGDPAEPLEPRILSTGAISGFLAKSPFARTSVLRAAEGFMLGNWTIERVQGPSYAPILAYMHLLAAFTSDPSSEAGDEALQWCGRELERGFRMHAFDPVSVARVFCRARARALPGAKLDPPELVTAIVTAQDDDGGWTAESSASRVDATLEAIEALQRLS